MAKSTITPNERLQLVGLLALAARHNRLLREIAGAVRELVGEDEEMGHAADAVYDDNLCDVDATLLERLHMTVEER